MSPARTVPDSPTIGRLRNVIRRYERDVGLLTGRIVPLYRDIDDEEVAEPEA
jgi:hypothetical protein